ncbi:MAG TPA: hypothetical protein VEC37_00045, partial [Bacillota bacterium]|nr:hypothetical protein [Bacillota bacterium]
MSTKPLGDMSHGYLLVKIMSQTSEEPKAFQLINIKAFKLVHKINDHVRLTFTADIEDKYRDHYFSLTDIKTKVEVYLNSET